MYQLQLKARIQDRGHYWHKTILLHQRKKVFSYKHVHTYLLKLQTHHLFKEFPPHSPPPPGKSVSAVCACQSKQQGWSTVCMSGPVLYLLSCPLLRTSAFLRSILYKTFFVLSFLANHLAVPLVFTASVNFQLIA